MHKVKPSNNFFLYLRALPALHLFTFASAQRNFCLCALYVYIREAFYWLHYPQCCEVSIFYSKAILIRFALQNPSLNVELTNLHIFLFVFITDLALSALYKLPSSLSFQLAENVSLLKISTWTISTVMWQLHRETGWYWLRILWLILTLPSA